MTRPMSEQERQEFLAEPHVGVVSVASDDDRPPLAVPVWYGYRPGGNITFFTGTQGRKARKTRLIRRAGVLSLSVQREEFPYRYVTVEGTVVREDRPPSAEQMLTVARRYLPEEAARGFVEAELGSPGPELVLFTVRPDRWLTADFTEEGNR
jgi:nitroimidazol reductase NimA-like FMN-containing flavoprotein (pyridoxamine 5'-phosphate oxidase superfamily)